MSKYPPKEKVKSVLNDLLSVVKKHDIEIWYSDCRESIMIEFEGACNSLPIDCTMDEGALTSVIYGLNDLPEQSQ